jgi:hypothetical protein
VLDPAGHVRDVRRRDDRMRSAPGDARAGVDRIGRTRSGHALSEACGRPARRPTRRGLGSLGRAGARRLRLRRECGLRGEVDRSGRPGCGEADAARKRGLPRHEREHGDAAMPRPGTAATGFATGGRGRPRSSAGSRARRPRPRRPWRSFAHSTVSNASGCGGTKTENCSSYCRRQIGHSGMGRRYTWVAGWCIAPVGAARLTPRCHLRYHAVLGWRWPCAPPAFAVCKPSGGVSHTDCQSTRAEGS